MALRQPLMVLVWAVAAALDLALVLVLEVPLLSLLPWGTGPKRVLLQQPPNP